MNFKDYIPILLILLFSASVCAEGPNLGYLFPAGGQRGTVVEVLAGGQRLQGVKEVWVSGKGVKVEVIKHYRTARNINGDQRRLLTKMIKDREDALTGKAKKSKKGTPKEEVKKGAEKEDKKPMPPIVLPPHPMLEGIEKMSLRELEVLRRTFFQRKRNQLNPQISELLKLRVTIADGAVAGDRMIRMVTGAGMSNPRCFQVGMISECLESEPNEPGAQDRLPPLKPLSLPTVVNGQILPGDVDRIRFHAKKGEPLVVDVRARQLIPYLADAVPGWFQVVVALLDEQGRELNFGDDFRFHPDPLLRYVIPADGVYQLELRDSIYRGREDFIYRVRIGRVPVITGIFPLGTSQGESRNAELRGWNLPVRSVKMAAGALRGTLREVSLTSGSWHSNSVPYVVDPYELDGMRQQMEREPNGNHRKAQAVKLPVMLNGRVGESGDRDVFCFVGREGQQVVAEVQARSLNSSLDSKLSLLDVRGETISSNDDNMQKDGHLHLGPGLLTHHADSYLRATLPADGRYFLVLGDAQHHGGWDYAYRLRISAPRPGFQVLVSPSAVLLPNGGHAPIRFHVVREDGFDGEVALELVDAPSGYRLHGALIPAGMNQVRATLEGPVRGKSKVTELSFKASAEYGGRELESPVQATDNRMQAFLWRHLVEREKFLVMTRWGKRYDFSVKLNGVATLEAGGQVEVRIRARKDTLPLDLSLKVDQAPEGISVTCSENQASGLRLTIHADPMVKPGLSGNLIVAVWSQPISEDGKKLRPKFIGTLPPIPFRITSPQKTGNDS